MQKRMGWVLVVAFLFVGSTVSAGHVFVTGIPGAGNQSFSGFPRR